MLVIHELRRRPPFPSPCSELVLLKTLGRLGPDRPLDGSVSVVGEGGGLDGGVLDLADKGLPATFPGERGSFWPRIGMLGEVFNGGGGGVKPGWMPGEDCARARLCCSSLECQSSHDKGRSNMSLPLLGWCSQLTSTPCTLSMVLSRSERLCHHEICECETRESRM